MLRRRGCVGRFAPPPDVGRAPRDAAPPGRVAGRAGALRGAAVRRLADGDGEAGFRATRAPDGDRTSDDFAVGLPDVAPGFLATPPFGVEPFTVVPFDAEVFAFVLLAVEPFDALPDGFLGAALSFDGVAPLAPLAPEAPAPARGVDDGRAPEPRAEPEGRAGRREEGMC